MKNLLKIGVFVLGTYLVSGCSTMQTALSADLSDVNFEIRHTDIKLAEKKELIMSKDKAYVVVVSNPKVKANTLIEDVNGELKILAYMDSDNSKAIIEVSEGTHTFVGASSCSVYRTTINAEKGNVYYLRNQLIKKFNTWDYCRDEKVFAYYTNAVVEFGETFKNRTNYSLVEENREKANLLVQNSSLPERYKDFMISIDTQYVARNSVAPKNAAIKIK